MKSLRAKTEVPLVLFSYFNPVLQMGLEKFADAARAAGADGVLITDLTPDEGGEYRAAMSSRGLDTIFLAAPTSTDERLALIAEASSGFLYLISRTGVTGAKDQLADELPALARRVRRVTEPAHRHRLRHFAARARFGAGRIGRRRRGGFGAGRRDRARRDAWTAAAEALAARVKLLKGAAVAGMSRREPHERNERRRLAPQNR